MACRPRGRGLQDKRIEVAIDLDAVHLDHIARRFAFAPQALAAAAVESRLAALQRHPQRLRRHVGHHQHLAGVLVLGNRGDEPLLVEFQFHNSLAPTL